ncbi:MAG: restriction endonuclease subunit S [Gammaproteobacteria bacterium]
MKEDFQTVQELCTSVISGGTPSRGNASYWDEGDIPWMKTGEIKQNFIYATEEYITQLGLNNSAAKMIPKNSVVVALYGDGYTAGSVATNKIPLTTNQACCNLIIDDTKAHYGFVYYYLKGSYSNLVSLKSGASQQNLNGLTIKSFPILKVALPIQRKIAAILTAYDDLIETNKRRIAVLEKMAEELYREWFVRMRFPGHQSAKFVKGVPEGWEELKLDDLIPGDGLETGKRPKGGAEDSGIPSIGAENVVGIGRYNFSKEKYVNESFYSAMRQGKVRGKDVLFYKDGAEIGRVSLFQDGFPYSECCVNEHVFLIRTQNLRYQYFLYFYLSQPQLREYVKLINKNAAQPGINKAELRSIPVVLPPSSLVEDFDKLVSPLASELFTLAKTDIILQQTRDLLLPRLISGKLSVEDLDIQFPPSMQEKATEPEPAHA